MSNFSSALISQMQRLSIAKSALATENEVAKDALTRADKVTNLLQPFLGRDNVPGFTQYTPATFQQVFSTSYALDSGTSLTQARGDGRLAAAVDGIRSTGAGFRTTARPIEHFLGIPEAELYCLKQRGGSTITLPIVGDLYQSAWYFERMQEALKERSKLLNSDKKLSKEERKQWLLSDAWTLDKILQYTTEYVCRAITYRMPADERHDLIDGELGFAKALDACEIIKVYD